MDYMDYIRMKMMEGVFGLFYFSYNIWKFFRSETKKTKTMERCIYRSVKILLEGYTGQNHPAEILSSISRLQNQKQPVEFLSLICRLQKQQARAEILSKVLSEEGLLPEECILSREILSRVRRLEKQQAKLLSKILSKEGLLSERVNIDAANARVVTPSRELQTDELTTVNIYSENAPSVVSISNMARQDVLPGVEQRYGTGFIWDDKGHIVTNYHVIDGANSLRVKFGDQSECEAMVTGFDPNTDIAVLCIVDLNKLKKLRPVTVGSSRDLLVGQNVYAIGNPFHFDGTLTTGVIGALGQKITSATTGYPILNVILTNAVINPGSSGGPLFESSGSLIGINTSFYSPPGTSAGYSFAIPVDTVSSIVDQLVKNGSVMRTHIAPDQSVEQLGVTGVALQMGQQEKQTLGHEFNA